MSEVKQADIEIVVNAMGNFFHSAVQQKFFDLVKFVDTMEEKFQAAGYRKPNGGGYGNPTF